MLLAQCLGQERIDFEYKEFCLKHLPYNYFTEDEILRIFSGEWNTKLNAIILQNIKIYIELYVSKYVASFANSNLNGNLLIGCNDFGEITGIPYLIHNDSEYYELKKQIRAKINQELSSKLSEQVSTNIEINKLKVNSSFLEDELSPLIYAYEKTVREYRILTKKFTKKKQLWMKNVLKYSAKLHILLNTPSIRKEFIDFITKRHGNKELIKHLKSTGYISPPSGEEMKVVREGENPDSLAFWLATFKDTTLDDIMTAKPKRPKKQIPQSPFMIIHRLSLLRYIFSKNPNVVFITIKVTANPVSTKNIVKYNDKQLGWVSNIRLCKQSGPCHERI